MFPGEIEFNCGAGEKRIFEGSEFYENGPLGRWWSQDAVGFLQKRDMANPQNKWRYNFGQLKFNLEQETKTVKVFVEQGVTITGRVTDPDGNPIMGATVAPALTGTGNSFDWRYEIQRRIRQGRQLPDGPASQ